MTTRITSPDRVRVDRGSTVPWRSARAARVLHLGRRSAVLESNRDLLVVTGDSGGLAPGGIQLADAELARLLGELHSRRGPLDLSGWAPATVVPIDLSISASPIDPAALARYRAAVITDGGGPMEPGPIRRLAHGAADDAIAVRDPTPALLRLIGAGPGSTPTGDDIVVGILAGFHAVGARLAAAVIADALPPLLERTTIASAHYLRAAADGRFADRVRDLVAGLAAPDLADRAVQHAAHWGATSGMDLLAGVVAGVRAGDPAIGRVSA